MLTEDEVCAIRSRFPIPGKKIYLNSCSQGALSDAVEAGLHHYVASWHEHGSPWDIWVERYEAARSQFAAFIGATADEVAIVPCASDGINSVASALTFHGRRKVVLGEFEFPTVGHIWLAQQRRGAQIEFVRSVGDHIPIERYERAIGRDTLIVPVTGVCFMNGFRSPLRAIVQLAHAPEILAGTTWLGIFYVRKELIESVQPTITGWFVQRNPFAFDMKCLDPAPSARKFEAGSPPVPNIYAAIESLGFLEQIGLDNTSAQVATLASALGRRTLKLGLHANPPAESMGPLLVLRCKDHQALEEKLASNIVCSSRHDGLRLSRYVYNTLDDIEAVFVVLERNLELLITNTATVGGN